MTVVRRLARPMLASMFLAGGVDSLRNPASKAPVAESVAPAIAGKLPLLPTDPEQLVTINAAVQVGAGTMLALGRFPRLSSLLLACSLVPTTMAAHRFWEIKDDPQRRAQQRIHFFKNLGLLGGLMLAIVDTQGRPGVAWRVRHATQHATHHAAHATHHAADTSRRAGRTARAKLPV